MDWSKSKTSSVISILQLTSNVLNTKNAMTSPFINANKAVFGVEYELDTEGFCDQANEMKFSWLKMEYDLDGGRISCKE